MSTHAHIVCSDSHANFILQAAVLDVQGLDFLSQHAGYIALLTLSHHCPARLPCF